MREIVLRYSKIPLSQIMMDFGSYIIFFFTPTIPVLIAVGILVSCDAVTGIIAAKKRGERIHSRKLERTVAKIVLFFIGILLSRMMEVVFFPSIPITSIVAGYIALTEFKSNLENISETTGIDIWKQILDKLQGIQKSNKK